MHQITLLHVEAEGPAALHQRQGKRIRPRVGTLQKRRTRAEGIRSPLFMGGWGAWCVTVLLQSQAAWRRLLQRQGGWVRVTRNGDVQHVDVVPRHPQHAEADHCVETGLAALAFVVVGIHGPQL